MTRGVIVAGSILLFDSAFGESITFISDGSVVHLVLMRGAVVVSVVEFDDVFWRVVLFEWELLGRFVVVVVSHGNKSGIKYEN